MLQGVARLAFNYYKMIKHNVKKKSKKRDADLSYFLQQCHFEMHPHFYILYFFAW